MRVQDVLQRENNGISRFLKQLKLFMILTHVLVLTKTCHISSNLLVVFLVYENVILNKAVHHGVELGVRSVHQRR